jgi:hypothetical protein
VVHDVQARALILAIALAASGCALDDRLPPSPATAAARDADRAADRLRAHVRALPGVVDAAVTVTLPVRDPLTTSAGSSPHAAVAITVAHGGDAPAIRAATDAAAHALLGADAAIAIDLLPAPTIAATSTRGRSIGIAAAIAAAATALTVALGLARVRAQRRGQRGISAQ